MMSKIDGLVERLCPDGVEWRALGDVVSYVNEKVPSKVINEGCYVGVNELRQDCRGRNRELRAPVEERCTAFHPGDILLGNIRPYLKKLWLADCAGGTNGDVLVLRVKDTSAMLPSFLWHILAGSAFTRYNIEHSKGAKMPRGDKKAILNYIVPVPPMEVQEEIVRVLDSFAEQEAELEKMLVAELEARKAQYAYYRDKLLDFGSRGGCAG